MKRFVGVAALLLVFAAQGVCSAEKTPWWKQQKIRFMWGAWVTTRHTGQEVPIEVMRNVAQSGATVFADLWTYIPANARAATELGMRYFAGTQARYPLWSATGRAWVKQDGETGTQDNLPIKCPLDDAVHEQWLVTPLLEAAKEGIVDGINVDWEDPGYASTPCYCDDCFARFLKSKGIEEALPDKTKRFGLIEERGLVKAYDDYFHQRRFEMFTGLRKKLQAVNHDFLFTSYDMLYTDFTRAMSTPETPFIILDSRHYSHDDRKPWWETYSKRLRQEGYLYIPGGWDNALFGSQPSQVSAAQWIYETSINEDGCWIWFEHELTDDMLRAYSSADHRIKTVQNKVGKYLFNGKRDYTFVTVTEWTGRPELQHAVVTCTYHLGNEHLLQVNNVNTEWPLRVRLRFPRLEAGKRWIVRDPMGEHYYTRDGKSAVWTTEDLLAGLVVALEPRTDLYLLVSPANRQPRVDYSQLMHSREFEVHPTHAAASARAGAVKGDGSYLPKSGPASSSGRLVYTATEPLATEQMVFKGGCGVGSLISNTIHTVNGDGTSQLRLRQLHGNLWSPNWSPDGKRIAFVHDTMGRGQIYLMAADGSNVANVSNSDYCDRLPVWSPDGRKIAFLSDRQGDWDIYVMNSDGSSQRRLAGNPGLDCAPAWSPDGKRLAWESHISGMPNIWVCDSDGQNSHPLIASDKPLKIQVAKAWRNPPAIVDIEPTFPDNTFWLSNPVWSPDGKRIACSGLSLGNMVAVLDADGTGMLQVIPSIPGAGNVKWSPDGTKLAGTLRTAPGESERSGIFLVRADGTEEYRWLVDVTPQGPRLGGARREGLNTWYSSGGAQPRRVVKTFESLTWSPDGKTLAFSSDMDPSGAFYVYTINPDGGSPTRLDATQSAWPNEIAWKPPDTEAI